MNKMPNHPASVKFEPFIFSRLTAVLALPLVALPAFVLLFTAAAPLMALTSILLVIDWSVVFATLAVLVPLLVSPEPSAAAVAPAGAFMMTPTHVPETFTNTSRQLTPTTWLPVRLKTVTFVVALPLVALPALVLSATVASPLAAVFLILFVVDRLFVLDMPKLSACDFVSVNVDVGALLATKLSKKLCGIRILPFRLPLTLITPINDLPELTTELIMFTTFAIASALPLVALPAFVLFATVAAPLAAASVILFCI